MQSHWLSALASVAQGGAGGPKTSYLQVLRGPLVIAQLICQQLPVEAMQLGSQVRPGLVAVAVGATAYQFGQALFSGLAGAIALPGEDLGELLDCASRAIGYDGTWFVKDVPPATLASHEDWQLVPALPELRMAIPAAWKSFDDYLSVLPSKYRTRARRAKSKLGAVLVRPLSTTDTERFGESLRLLYEQLMTRTSYAPFVLDAGYVPKLKAALPERVLVLGFFDEQELVGFATLLHEGGEGLAHVAAVTESYNAEHQLYLNMLFALLETAIEMGCASLNFGRTATTIKSSVGAKPVLYDSYVRHTGCVRNQLIRQLVDRVVDPADAGALVQRPLD